MHRDHRRGIGRSALYGVILLLFLVELALFRKITAFGAMPELVLVGCIFFGFYSGISFGVEAGLMAGLLKDTFSITPFGINAFSFLCVGFLAGFFRNRLFKENFIIQFLFSFSAVYVISGIYYLLLYNAAPDSGRQLLTVSLHKGLRTAFAAPFIFFILSKIFKTEEEEA